MPISSTDARMLDAAADVSHLAHWTNMGVPCRGKVDVFFGRTDTESERAITLCTVCKFQAVCLYTTIAEEMAADYYYIFGVSGGLVPQQRRAIMASLTPLQVVDKLLTALHQLGFAIEASYFEKKHGRVPTSLLDVPNALPAGTEAEASQS
ncbi:WhiB family transcriptional regulator [Ferrimicrobium acidiphilum]|uniref:WhiB family transcriptional regulator n=1 Tax=Ferrimicrobium acidiphilum TaxID=121039 RepID=UPI0023F538A8|nr:WhiB family transcriptional regulator [Ferrimicrobium acidiphilum]